MVDPNDLKEILYNISKKIIIPRIILSSILILLGLYIGNYIDKDLFSQIHEWVFTSLIMFAYIILSIFVNKLIQ